MRPLTLSETVENLIRVNSWNSWPAKNATNSTKTITVAASRVEVSPCDLDAIGSKYKFQESHSRAIDTNLNGDA